MSLLIGNSFPLSLVRREITIVPSSIEELKRRLEKEDVHSFWGHRNTLRAAETVLGTDLTPRTERPALALSENGLPFFDGIEFNECWVLSPDYTQNFRPKIGEEVCEERIANWNMLRMRWIDA